MTVKSLKNQDANKINTTSQSTADNTPSGEGSLSSLPAEIIHQIVDLATGADRQHQLSLALTSKAMLNHTFFAAQHAVREAIKPTGTQHSQGNLSTDQWQRLQNDLLFLKNNSLIHQNQNAGREGDNTAESKSHDIDPWSDPSYIASVQQSLKSLMSPGALRARMKHWCDEEKRQYPDSRPERAVDRIVYAYEKDAEELRLSNFKLSSIPKEIAFIRRLKFLSVTRNRLTSLPDFIGQIPSIERLHLGCNRFPSFPDVVYSLPNLKHLLYEKNSEDNGNRIPEAINKLSKLETLAWDSNKITTIPETLFDLKRLKTLTLGDNPLTVLSKSIGRLVNLEKLDLLDTLIVELPESMGDLSVLRTLFLGSMGDTLSEITQLPETMKALQNLTTLSLTGSHCETFPEVIGSLKNLQKLHLSKNRVTAIPTETILALSNLTLLDVKENPLTQPIDERLRRPGLEIEIDDDAS